MRTVSFVIPGKPFGKQRPRVTRLGRVYTPKETVDFEAVVRDIALQHFAEPFVGPVRVSVEAIFEPPPSWSGKRRRASLGAPHIGKPDLDNVMKALGDSLNRVAFADDTQIAEASLRKRWGETAETRVKVEVLT